MNVLRSVSHVRPAPASSPRTPPDYEKAPGEGGARTLLTAPRGSEAEHLGRRCAGRSPILLFGLTTLLGYLVLAALMIGLGFLLVDVLLPIHAIGHDDEAVNEWLASNRSSSLSDASYVGSMIGDIPFIPDLVIVDGTRRRHPPSLARVRLHRRCDSRRGRDLPRDQSDRAPRAADGAAPRSEHLPVNQSFRPDTWRPRSSSTSARAAHLGARARSTADDPCLDPRDRAPLIVAASRMYRGMHHPTDVASGPDGTRRAGHRAVRRACGW
jgi:hypothetical protein